jgi:glycosyltransferase involved in cell wall biosynthesis
LERPLIPPAGDGENPDPTPGSSAEPQPGDGATTQGRIAMVVHAYYDEDPRVRREAETLAAAGFGVEVFGLRRDDDPATGIVDGVTVHRLAVQRHQGAPVSVYLREYLSFLVRAAWALTRSHRRRRYRAVQVHSLPDFLVFAALPLRLVGVPVVLDLHEAMPEFFRQRFPAADRPLAYRLLRLQERLSIAFATAVLTVNEALAARLVDLGVRSGKVRVVPNRPSLRRFDPLASPARVFAEDGVVRIVYAGALTPMYELDVVVDAIAELRTRRPDLVVELDVYGRGDAAESLEERAVAAGLSERVRFHGRIPLEDVPAAIAAADIGVAPTRRNRFTDISLSTKIYEYAAMGKPVIATRLPLVEAAFPAGTVYVYEPGDVSSLAEAIARVADDGPARGASVAAALELARTGSWESVAGEYVALVADLAARS